ncbi:MAG: hypothetical protein HYY32_04400 [Chloroflexi bacterium]|nr:hypothetical protein [Chloroflexota bacterium]
MKALQRISVLAILGLTLASLLSGCKGAAVSPTSAPASTTAPSATTAPASTTKTTSPSAPVTTTSAPVAAPTGPYGDLRVGLATFGSEARDPIRGTAGERANFFAQMLDSLITLDGANLVPGVAEKWELAPDGLSWILSVRKGIKFSNGDGLTADDVAFSLSRYASPNAFTVDLRNAIDRVQKVDDYTVRVYTKGPQPYFLSLISLYTPIMGLVQPKQYTEQGGQENYNERPIGSGPFKFVKRVPGDSVTYEAVTSHWRQVPAFKNLTLVFAAEETTRVAMLKTGVLDIIDIGLDAGRDLEKSPGYKALGGIYAQNFMLVYGAYHPDAAAMPLSNIKVRQALSLAIDRDDIRKNLFYGKAAPALPAFTVVETAIDVDVPYWQDLAAKTYARYDPQEAQRLLKDAGYSQGITIKLWSFSMDAAPYMPKIAEVVASYWGKIGVKVELVPTDWGSFQPLRQTPTARGTVALMRVTGRPTAGNTLSTYLDPKGNYVMLGRAFPDIEQLVPSAVREPDAGKRKPILAQIIKTVADAQVAIPIGGVPAMVGAGPKVDVDFPIYTLMSPPMYVDRVKHSKN